MYFLSLYSSLFFKLLKNAPINRNGTNKSQLANKPTPREVKTYTGILTLIRKD